MKVKEAIAQAKALLGEYYADEGGISDVRLEEVEFDEPSDSWLITLGLLRPLAVAQSAIVARTQPDGPTRTYKIFKIPNEASAFPSMKMRELLVDG